VDDRVEVAAIGPDRIFRTLPTAVAGYEEWRSRLGPGEPPG